MSGIGCLRVEIYRQVTLKIECAPGGYAVSAPTGSCNAELHVIDCESSLLYSTRFPFSFLSMITGATNDLDRLTDRLPPMNLKMDGFAR